MATWSLKKGMRAEIKNKQTDTTFSPVATNMSSACQ